MATVVEETSEGTIYKSQETAEVPLLDLLSLLFDSERCCSAEDFPIHVSAAHPERRLTKRDARVFTQRAAYALRNSFGIGSSGPGKDVVLSTCTGHYMLPTLFYGTIAADGVFSAASPASTVQELESLLRMTGSKVLLCTEATKSVAVNAAGNAGLSTDSVLVLPNEQDAFALRSAGNGNDILSQHTLDWRRITDSNELEHSFVVLIFSSGTTGPPKGVKLSHQNLVAECTIINDYQRSWRAKHAPSFQYRTLAHLPTAHIAGIQGYFINAFYYGGTTFWMPAFDFVRFLQYNKQHCITYFFTVPPIFLAIAKSPLVEDHFDALEYTISGAAPLGADLQREASTRLGRGKTNIVQTWGLSESTASITIEPLGLEPDRTGSVGMLIPNHEARIVDDAGNDVAVGSPGEILIRGPVVTKGYFHNPHANAEAFRDGWYCTGDVAQWRDGRIYIVDRKKVLLLYANPSSLAL